MALGQPAGGPPPLDDRTQKRLSEADATLRRALDELDGGMNPADVSAIVRGALADLGMSRLTAVILALGWEVKGTTTDALARELFNYPTRHAIPVQELLRTAVIHLEQEMKGGICAGPSEALEAFGQLSRIEVEKGRRVVMASLLAQALDFDRTRLEAVAVKLGLNPTVLFSKFNSFCDFRDYALGLLEVTEYSLSKTGFLEAVAWVQSQETSVLEEAATAHATGAVEKAKELVRQNAKVKDVLAALGRPAIETILREHLKTDPETISHYQARESDFAREVMLAAQRRGWGPALDAAVRTYLGFTEQAS